jgi:hypothetical protein
MNTRPELVTDDYVARLAVIYDGTQLPMDAEARDPGWLPAAIARLCAWGWPRNRVLTIGDLPGGGDLRLRPGYRRLHQAVADGRVGLVVARDPVRIADVPAVLDQFVSRCIESDTALEIGGKLVYPAKSACHLLLQVDAMWQTFEATNPRQRETR